MFDYTAGEAFRPVVPEDTDVFAQRNCVPFFGAGLMADIDEAEILANQDVDDADGDGTPNAVALPNGSDSDVDGHAISNSEDDDVDGDGVANDEDLCVAQIELAFGSALDLHQRYATQLEDVRVVVVERQAVIDQPAVPTKRARTR